MKPVKMISMDTIQREEIKWLWYPYIAFGKLTIVQGDPGEGKTTFALKLAAELSNGRCFSGKGSMDLDKPVNVIYQTAEDRACRYSKTAFRGRWGRLYARSGY